MRQLHVLFNSAKTWHVIVCWLLCFPLNLPDLNLKLFCSDVQNNFRFSSGKFGENTEINKQSHVKFLLNWIKYGAVSYSLSFTLCCEQIRIVTNWKFHEIWKKIVWCVIISQFFWLFFFNYQTCFFQWCQITGSFFTKNLTC